MEISQHIKNLLKTNERVILGGFGAFNSKQISAKYDAETKTMNPPNKVIVFDQNTKEDAGILAKHMAEQEGFSLDNANEQIQEYVKMINSRLSSGQKVEFKDLGTFDKGSDGNLNFTFLSIDNLLIDSFGLSTVSLDAKTENVPTKQPVKKKVIEKKKPIEKKPVTQKPKVQKPAKPKPVKKAKPTKVKSDSGKPKKRRTGLIVFLGFIAAIGITLTALYFFKPDLWDKGYAFSTEKFTVAKSKISQLFNGGDNENYDIITPDEITDEVIDTSSAIVENSEIIDDSLATEEGIDNVGIIEEQEIIPEDDIVETETIVEEVAETVTNNTNVSPAQKGKYYIIVSSVKSESSAKKEQKRFSSKGVSTSIVHATSIGRYRISAGEFNTIKEAQNAYSDIQAKHGNIEAWVWEKK